MNKNTLLLILAGTLAGMLLGACADTATATPPPATLPPATPTPTDTPTITPTFTPQPSSTPTPTPMLGPASLVFHNGRVLTMDGQMRIAEALAVLGDRIMAVGSDDEIRALAGPSTLLVDLQGHALMPGFVDPHTHIFNDAEGQGMTLEQAQDLALESGITTLADMFIYPEFLQRLQAMEASGTLQVRTSAYLIGTDNCGGSQGSWYTAYPPTDEFGEMLRIGGVKLFTDGGTCGPAAVSAEVDPGAGQGKLFMTDAELKERVRMADDAGYQVVIHALGDRAVDQALDALNAAIESPGNPERHRVEHVMYLSDGQAARFSEMGVNPVVFGNAPSCYIRDNPQSLTNGFKNMFYRWRELLDANPGLVIAGKTDYPWMGKHASPLHELYSLTTLNEIAPDGSVCQAPGWLKQRALTIDEGLRMVTISAAYMLFREDEVGSLEPGKLADLVVLSASPLEVEPDGLKDIQVWMTMIGGEVKYCAAGQEAFCP